MKKQFLTWSTMMLLATTIMTGCEKDKGEDHGEEVITTVTLTFTPAGGGAPLVFEFNDPDGPGGTAPTTDDIQLVANTTYNVAATFRNDIAGEDITAEIVAEADAHRVYYTVGGGSNITVSNLNNDGNGVTLGTSGTWTTTAAANGQVTVTLRHYGGNPPNKAAADPVNSPKSSTDVEVVFATEVQ
jgi:hypothetical protein